MNCQAPPPRPSDPLDLRMHIMEPMHTVIKSCAHQKNLRITPVYAEKNESIQC